MIKFIMFIFIGIGLTSCSNTDLSNNYFANEEDVGEMYSVKQIPLYVLIDKQRVIVAKWNHINDDALSVISKCIAD